LRRVGAVIYIEGHLPATVFHGARRMHQQRRLQAIERDILVGALLDPLADQCGA
jgi:hypothetical protein